jgi:RimJ/RimL family protein N-acetyltransferase
LAHEPIFAYFDKTVFVGIARLDLTSIQTYEIGIIVNPDLRGIGYGKAILHDVCTYLSSDEYARFEVLAFVHVDNTSSRSLFKSFNFFHKTKIGSFDVFRWIPSNSSIET